MIIALTTVPTLESAQKIGNLAVEQKLSACVNRIKIDAATYQWENAIHNDAEYLLMFKTSKEQSTQLEEMVCALHPYDTPMFCLIKTEYVNKAYEDWLTSSLGK